MWRQNRLHILCVFNTYILREGGDILNEVNVLYKKYKDIEPEITCSMRKIEILHSVKMENLNCRLKKKRDIEKKLQRPNTSWNLNELKDILRYTYVLPNSPFIRTAEEVISDIEKETGFKCIERKNYWNDDSVNYKGYNTEFTKDGLLFEVQFHTEESVYIRNISHGIYERKRKIEKNYDDINNLEKSLWNSVVGIN